MLIAGKPHRAIWPAENGRGVHILDQTHLPHALPVAELRSLEEAARAIETMQVRGAP